MDKNIKTFDINSNKYLLNRPMYPEVLFETISNYCKDHEMAWDSGCGNGQAAIGLTPFFKNIQATDISENQIKYAFKNSQINYSLQPSEKTSFPNEYFDLVCVAQALHWYDFQNFFNEVKRVLKAGGLFVCFGYSFIKIDKIIDNLFHEHIYSRIEKYWSEKNLILHNKYKDVNFPFKKLNPPIIDMKIKYDRVGLLDYINTWSAVKLYNQEKSTSITDNFNKVLQDYWPDKEFKEILFDFFYYFGLNE